MDLYAVIGHPVAHSKSPKIHSLFAQQTGEEIEYTAIQAPLGGFQEVTEDFFERGGKGLNVTLPFKGEAWQLSAQKTDRAQVAGAVNTLYQQNGQICGDNTDGAGLVRDLMANQNIKLTGKKVLVLGAGGAVRGVLLPLLQQQPATLMIANRTIAKAQQLVQLFADFGNIETLACEELSAPFDLIINGTSASLAGKLPPIPAQVITGTTITYDMMYSSSMTPFNQWAQMQGAATCIDGLGMLVEQAAESFTRWRGVRPDTTPVLQHLREEALSS